MLHSLVVPTSANRKSAPTRGWTHGETLVRIGDMQFAPNINPPFGGQLGSSTFHNGGVSFLRTGTLSGAGDRSCAGTILNFVPAQISSGSVQEFG